MPHAAARRRRCCMQLPFTSWPLLGPLLPEAVVPTLVIIKTRPDPHTGRWVGGRPQAARASVFCSARPLGETLPPCVRVLCGARAEGRHGARHHWALRGQVEGGGVGG